MSKKSSGSNSALSLACFVLFIVWAIATLLNYVGLDLGEAAGIVEMIARIAAFVSMGYFAYLYYQPRKNNTTIAVLFWISLVVGVCAIIVPLF